MSVNVPVSKPFRKTICLDFDATIHTYDRGWQGGELYGGVVPGFFEWACSLPAEEFELTIYSSRSKDSVLRSQMTVWLERQLHEWLEATGSPIRPVFNYSHEKPAAWVTIDDRAITFLGDWTAPNLQRDTLAQFKPWNQAPVTSTDPEMIKVLVSYVGDARWSTAVSLTEIRNIMLTYAPLIEAIENNIAEDSQRTIRKNLVELIYSKYNRNILYDVDLGCKLRVKSVPKNNFCVIPGDATGEQIITTSDFWKL